MSSIIASFIQIFNYKEIAGTINLHDGKAGWATGENINQYVDKIWNDTQKKESIIFQTAYKKAIKRMIKGSCKQSLKEKIDKLIEIGKKGNADISSKWIKKEMCTSLGITGTSTKEKEKLKHSSYSDRKAKLEEIQNTLMQKIPPSCVLAFELSEQFKMDQKVILNEVLKLEEKDVLLLLQLYKQFSAYQNNSELITIANAFQVTQFIHSEFNANEGKRKALELTNLLKTANNLEKCEEFIRFLLTGQNLSCFPEYI